MISEGSDIESNGSVGSGSSPSHLQPHEKRVRFSISSENDPEIQESNKHTNMPTRKDVPLPEEEISLNHQDPSFERKYSRNANNNIDHEKGIVVDKPSKKKKVEDEDDDDDDPWAVNPIEIEEKNPGKPWKECSTKEKICTVLSGIGRGIALLALLYFFVCSLDILSLGFRLVGGRTAGEIFRRSELLQNPVVGVMIGILTTVLVQSSSTSTSILVGMVAAEFLDVRVAIPMIMGANIGTSITNTIVSFSQAGDRAQFRRAFAGATILDMFNWITVIVLLIVEVITDYLYHVSKAVMDGLIPDSGSGGEIQLLSVLTNPFVNLIIQLDDSVMECWSNPNCTEADGKSLVKQYCSTSTSTVELIERVVDIHGFEIINDRDVTVHQSQIPCDFVFANTGMSDALVGGILLITSLLVLCTCLVMIVKVLNSVLQGKISTVIQKTLNANIPYVPWITGYIAILVGAFMTFLVQSSSVFTSALTPLVGLGVLSLERVYPLTLGANIGTTTTALIASMAVEGKQFKPSMQIALCHFFFNVTGILLFYPIPFMRFPITLAKFLGNTTAKYRWFAIAYMVFMFAIFPIVIIGLSFAGAIYVIVLVSIIFVIAFFVGIITVLQKYRHTLLPSVLRSWKWLPAPLRSLQPYDDFFARCTCCKSLKEKNQDRIDEEDDNFVFYPLKNMEQNGRNSLSYENRTFSDIPTSNTNGYTNRASEDVDENIISNGDIDYNSDSSTGHRVT